MSETVSSIVNIIDKIAAAKGEDYAKGFADCATILSPAKRDEEKAQ